MGANLLRNGDFEADWSEEGSHRCWIFPTSGDPYEADRDNIFTPTGWITWYRHGLPVEHDPENPIGWSQPEARDTLLAVDPRRVHAGNKGQLLFTFYRVHDAGFLQRVPVQPGTRLRLTAWAHAWSGASAEQGSPHPDDPRWSEGNGVGYNDFYAEEGTAGLDSAARNFTFAIGIDPTGGTNPYAPTVVWGRGAHIYNAYHEVPAVEAVARANTVTVFLRSRTLWQFKHNDAYWDDVKLEALDGGGSPPPPQPPPGGGEWNYPVIGQGSKLSIHCILPDGVMAYGQTLLDGGTRFGVVKATEDLSWVAGFKALSPETIIIGRRVHPLESCPGLHDPGVNLDALADGLMQPIDDSLAADPTLRDVVTYWEVCNEPAPSGVDGYARLAQLMIKCMDRAEQRGLKLGLFALNAGTPEWNQMVAMVESGAFARARAGGHILTVHEGVFGVDDPIDKWWGSQIPGSPVVPGAGALCFRYRYLYHLLEQRKEVVPLVVSEFYAGGGYAQDGTTPEAIVARFRWYDERFRQDYYTLGFCPFTVGPTAEWRNQNYEFAYPQALQYMISIKDEANSQPPVGQVQVAIKPPDPYEPATGEKLQVVITSPIVLRNVRLRVTNPNGQAVAVRAVPFPEAPPGQGWKWTFTPLMAGEHKLVFTSDGGAKRWAETTVTVRSPAGQAWGAPRIQYARTYVLLPPTAGREWAQAVLESGGWERHHWTIGSNADDAGIGALNNKTVIAVNPAEWQMPLQAFFQRNYPRTRYIAVRAATPAELREKLRNM